jgi:acyl-CoA synthetase (AMP-forming)/AMP-acid ligase II
LSIEASLPTSTAASLRAYASWNPEAFVSPLARENLLAPGAAFELAREDVFGSELTVFKRRPRRLRDILDAQVQQRPSDLHFVTPEGEWTFAEVAERADATAALLIDRYGVKVGDRVAIVAANSVDYAILMWAVVSIGGVIASLNGWWTAAELQYGLDLSKPVLLAGDERRLARLTDVTLPEGLPVRRLDELQAEASEFAGQQRPSRDFSEDDPAVILFTSGTTGRAKGATLAHRNLLHMVMSAQFSAAATRFNLTEEQLAAAPRQTATIISSPLFHVSGMSSIFVTGAGMGAKLLFPASGRWNPAEHMRLTQEHRLTRWTAVPTQYWRILRHPDFESYDLSSVAQAGGGGAVWPAELVREFGRRMPGVSLNNGYGMSESFGVGALNGGPLMLAAPDSVGIPSPCSEIEIRDELGEPLAEGEVGEIHLRNPSVFIGYWDDDAATQAVLDTQRWYRTGDFGRIERGLLFVESRRHDLILRGAENVYPIEIENRLVEHESIADAAVIGIPDLELGQQVKAFVVLSEGATLEPEAISAWCAQTLATFKVPTEYEFVDALPYTETGKLLKRELEAREQARRS